MYIFYLYVQIITRQCFCFPSSQWGVTAHDTIVLVREKDGKLRFCIDLRKLNKRTMKDSYSLPRIEHVLDQLLGSTIFTTLDLKAG